MICGGIGVLVGFGRWGIGGAILCALGGAGIGAAFGGIIRTVFYNPVIIIYVLVTIFSGGVGALAGFNKFGVIGAIIFSAIAAVVGLIAFEIVFRMCKGEDLEEPLGTIFGFVVWGAVICAIYYLWGVGL
jgi:hypothetical protein